MFSQTTYKRRIVWHSLVAAAMLAGFALPAAAHHPSASPGAGTAGPVVTRSPDTLPAGRCSVSAQVEFIDLDDIEDDRLEHFAEQGIEGVHGTETILATHFGAAVGLCDDLMLSVSLPVIRRTDIDEGHPEAPGVGEVEKLGDSAGVGDLVVLGTWRFLNDPEHGRSAALITGVKTPTGDTYDRSDDGSERFEAEFQPGSGSWDPLIGAAASIGVGPVTVSASILAQFATEGSQNTDLGDVLYYDLAAAYRVMGGRHQHGDGTTESHRALNLVLELNGDWRTKEETSGMKDPHSGGNTLYISPGVRFTHPAGFTSWLSVGVPISQDLNGKQPDATMRVLAGVAQAF
jgi:hypothetical protein